MASIYQLVLFLIFLSATSVVSARKTTKYPYKSPSLDEAQDKFLNAQSTIIRIRAGEIITESLDDLKSRLDSLQTEIEKLVKLSNSPKAESEACEDAMKNMRNSYQSVDDRLKILQMQFEDHILFQNRSVLFSEIIEDIRMQRFKLADEKCEQLHDISEVPKIIHEVYAYSEDNFGLILNFAVAVSDNVHCFEVLKALHEEMSTNGHKNPLKLIILAEAFEKEVLRNNSSDLGIVFRDELARQIQTTAFDMLIKAMKFGGFSSNEEIKILLEAIYDFSPKISDDVIQKLVDESYGVVESHKILAHIFIQCNTPQAISGIANLFWKIKDAGHLNDSVLVLDIASNLSELISRKDFPDISKELEDSMEKVVKHIPECARNLFFEPSVCLWNKARNVYIQAANESFNFDGQRRRIFTTPSEGIPLGASWVPERKGDDILFRSEDFEGEYLYFAEIEYNSEMRYLFNWIQGNNKDNQSAFKIELLDNDLCYLKSTRYNEYLYASDVTYKKDNAYSYVFSWKPGTKGDMSSDFVWQIRSC